MKVILTTLEDLGLLSGVLSEDGTSLEDLDSLGASVGDSSLNIRVAGQLKLDIKR